MPNNMSKNSFFIILILLFYNPTDVQNPAAPFILKHYFCQ